MADPDVAALETHVRELSAKLREAEADVTRYHHALALLADQNNWFGNPRSYEARFFGHDTPWELAQRALGREDKVGEFDD